MKTNLHSELRPLRQKYQESLPEYEARKRTYETEVRAIENSVTSVASVRRPGV